MWGGVPEGKKASMLPTTVSKRELWTKAGHQEVCSVCPCRRRCVHCSGAPNLHLSWCSHLLLYAHVFPRTKVESVFPSLESGLSNVTCFGQQVLSGTVQAKVWTGPMNQARSLVPSIIMARS